MSCENCGFNLTKWISNSREVLHTVPEVERSKEGKTLDLDQELLPAERTFSVLWQVEPDTYGFHVHLEERPLTRCGLLSTVSSVHDPFGVCQALHTKGKDVIPCKNFAGLNWAGMMP